MKIQNKVNTEISDELFQAALVVWGMVFKTLLRLSALDLELKVERFHGIKRQRNNAHSFFVEFIELVNKFPVVHKIARSEIDSLISKFESNFDLRVSQKTLKTGQYKVPHTVAIELLVGIEMCKRRPDRLQQFDKQLRAIETAIAKESRKSLRFTLPTFDRMHDNRALPLNSAKQNLQKSIISAKFKVPLSPKSEQFMRAKKNIEVEVREALLALINTTKATQLK